MSEPAAPTRLDELDELDEDGRVDERTVVVERDLEAERTVVVERGLELHEHTVVVERDLEVEHTVVVDRGIVDERTVVVPRTATPPPASPDAATEVDEDPTEVSARRLPVAAPPDLPAPASDAVAVPPALRLRGRNRTLAPAPLDPASLKPSARGPGVGTIDAYRPRAVPRAARRTAPPPVVVDVDDIPVRDAGARRASVARRARRGAFIGMVSVGASVVVSIAGLVALAAVVATF